MITTQTRFYVKPGEPKFNNLAHRNKHGKYYNWYCVIEHPSSTRFEKTYILYSNLFELSSNCWRDATDCTTFCGYIDTSVLKEVNPSECSDSDIIYYVPGNVLFREAFREPIPDDLRKSFNMFRNKLNINNYTLDDLMLKCYYQGHLDTINNNISNNHKIDFVGLDGFVRIKNPC